MLHVQYVVCGVGTALLYAKAPEGIQGNILMNLPTDSMVATVVRLCYAAVCASSFPLTLVPACDMVANIGVCAGPTGGSSESPEAPAKDKTTNIPLRVVMVYLSTIVGLSFPHFGLIVSIIGSFSVSILSFVLPSAMHLAVSESESLFTAANAFDLVLLAAGVCTCIVTTTMTIRSIAMAQ